MKIRLTTLSCILLIIIGLHNAQAQNIEDIMQKHIDAIGGLEKWEKVNSVVMKGNISKNGRDMAITVTKLQNKGMKFEYTMGEMKGFTLFTDKGGWAYNSYRGPNPEPLPDAMTKQKQEHLDAQGMLVNYKRKGHKASFDGIESDVNAICYRIIVKSALGNVSIFYLDTSTYYVTKIVEKVVTNNQEAEQATLYGNYKKLPEGIVYPMLINVGSGPMEVTSVEINKAIPENFFEVGK